VQGDGDPDGHADVRRSAAGAGFETEGKNLTDDQDDLPIH
jgi:hypothetical protein